MRIVLKNILKVLIRISLYAVILISSFVCMLRVCTISALVNNELMRLDYFVPLDHVDLMMRKEMLGLLGHRMNITRMGIIYDSDSESVEYKTVKMGRYPQVQNEAEPIEWLIIDEKNGRTLLLSKYYLDAVTYDNRINNISWENSQLRKWLNDDFYKRAFGEQERKKIKTTAVISDSYYLRDANDGWSGEDLPSKITWDNVFVLDKHEKLIYLTMTGNDYYAKATEYAKQHENIPDDYRDYLGVHDEDPDWIRFRAVPNIGEQILWSFKWVEDEEYNYSMMVAGSTEDTTRYALYVRPAMWVDSGYVRKLKERQ